MKQDLTRIYNGGDLSGATAGIIYLPIVRDSTLEKVSVRSDAAQSGAAVFEVRKNGAVITGLSALTIANGAKIGTGSGLSIALTDGDEITLNLLSGNVSAPVTLNLATDDGSSSGGGGAGELDGLFSLTAPGEVADYTPLAPGQTTIAKRGNCLLAKLTDTSGSFSIRSFVKPIPTTNFTVEIAFRGFAQGGDGFGLILYDSVSGKAKTMRATYVALKRIELSGWNSLTSFNSNIFYNDGAIDARNLPLSFFRVVRDATNFNWYSSIDGDLWTLFYSETVAGNFMPSPDRAGFCLTVGQNAPAQITVASLLIS